MGVAFEFIEMLLISTKGEIYGESPGKSYLLADTVFGVRP